MRGIEKLPTTILVFVILFVLGLVLASPAFAIDKFLQKKEEGWFWYEREPEPPPEPLPPEPQKPAPQVEKKAEPKKAPALSVEWFQNEYLKILNAAVDDPSPENVRKYRYSTRVMLDKASNFSQAFQRESLLDPLLDEANRMPFSSASRGSFMRLTIQEQIKATKEIGKKAGLWIFLDESCAFCALQYPIISARPSVRTSKAAFWLKPRQLSYKAYTMFTVRLTPWTKPTVHRA